MDELAISFDIYVEIPFSSETSSKWNGNISVDTMFINNCTLKIKRIIQKYGYITIPRIFRIFGLAEQLEHPYMFVNDIREVNWIETKDINDTLIITMHLICEYLPALNPSGKHQKQYKPYLVDPEEENQRLDEPVVTKRDETGKPVAGRYPWNAGTLQKEPGADTDGDETDLAKPDSQEKQGL